MKFNRFLDGVIRFGDDVIGRSASAARSSAHIAAENEARGLSAKDLLSKADHLGKRSTNARVKAGVGAAALVTGGFLGIHKYHQHQDNKIMRKLDQIYGVQDTIRTPDQS
jgi:hypothetical protein